MFHFHVNLFTHSLNATFPLSFEETQSRLTQLPRMDTEPDGNFLVAGGESDGLRWVINGQLFESGDRLHRIELHGTCPEVVFDDLLRCFGWPDVELSFELVREGLTLDEASFRERAQQPP
jgi:hypothetical protein